MTGRPTECAAHVTHIEQEMLEALCLRQELDRPCNRLRVIVRTEEQPHACERVRRARAHNPIQQVVLSLIRPCHMEALQSSVVTAVGRVPFHMVYVVGMEGKVLSERSAAVCADHERIECGKLDEEGSFEADVEPAHERAHVGNHRGR
jgi:hypothetical protein